MSLASYLSTFTPSHLKHSKAPLRAFVGFLGVKHRSPLHRSLSVTMAHPTDNMTMIIQNQNPRVYMISLGDISALLRIPIGVPRSIFILVFILQVYLRSLGGVYGDIPSLDEVDEHAVPLGAIVS